jgi:hypothetical protein
MLYQQIAFLRERVLELKMSILNDTSGADRFSLCLLNAHYIDSNGQVWLFITNNTQNVEAFAKPRHVSLHFFSPERNFHVESTGMVSNISKEDLENTRHAASAQSMFVVKVDISHMEYYELKTRKAKNGFLSLLYYKWLNFVYHNQSSRLLVLRRSS